MNDSARTIQGPHGPFARQENGLIYFYKNDGVTIDKATALEYLKSVRALDDSGKARLIVIQGHHVEYTFDAQHVLLTNALISGLAFVIQTNTQLLTAGLLKDMAKTFQAKYPVAIFNHIEEAEEWLLALSAE